MIKELMNNFVRTGTIEWIGVRPDKKVAPIVVDSVQVSSEEGLIGDHYSGKSGHRQVTLIQAEHLQAVASFLNKDQIDPGLTRRNIVVNGINLQSLKDRQFRIGDTVVLEYTGDCHPCSRMEENLGPGGYNAMRSHGGITARVIAGGEISKGDAVRAL
jgi:MOSC domain-containing protein YiiM